MFYFWNPLERLKYDENKLDVSNVYVSGLKYIPYEIGWMCIFVDNNGKNFGK